MSWAAFFFSRGKVLSLLIQLLFSPFSPPPPPSPFPLYPLPLLPSPSSSSIAFKKYLHLCLVQWQHTNAYLRILDTAAGEIL